MNTHTAYIAVGSNLGDRKQYIELAKTFLFDERAIHFLRSSSVIETKPLYNAQQPDYVNVVWEIQTYFDPKRLMTFLLNIEQVLGRRRMHKKGSRTIDLDILFFDALVLNASTVTIPHPRLHERPFILKLLNELCPEYRHPVLKKTIKELYANMSRDMIDHAHQKNKHCTA